MAGNSCLTCVTRPHLCSVLRSVWQLMLSWRLAVVGRGWCQSRLAARTSRSPTLEERSHVPLSDSRIFLSVETKAELFYGLMNFSNRAIIFRIKFYLTFVFWYMFLSYWPFYIHFVFWFQVLIAWIILQELSV